MVEVESIINSRLLTVETLSDMNSQIPLSPSNLLTMKANIVMPPPGIFMKPSLYSKRRWRHVQHIAEEFWHRWRKEILQSLQSRQKWNHKRRNFEVGDIVILKEQDCQRNQCPLGRLTGVDTDKNGDVCSVLLVLAFLLSGILCYVISFNLAYCFFVVQYVGFVIYFVSVRLCFLQCQHFSVSIV